MKYINGRARVALVAMVATLALVACGGGGGSIADGGIRGTGKSVGPVSGFGSVIVNGIRYETDDTVFVVNDDEAAVQGALSEGMLVIVETNDGRDAERIRYSDDLRGPLTGAFDPLSNQMVILGQPVRFNDSTVFRGLTREQLAAESNPAYIRVSGWYLDSDELLASYVHARTDFSPSTDGVKLRGTITSLTADTLNIGTQVVDYSQTPEIEMDDDRDQLVQGDVGTFVEVEGYLNAEGVILADEIEEEDRNNRLGDINGNEIRIEGNITRGLDKSPSGIFVVAGVTVRFNPDTDLLGGITEADLTEGTRVYVEGVGNTQSLVVAKLIENREPDAEVEGSIDAGSIAAGSNPREGTFTVGNVRVKVNLRTILVEEDDDVFGNLVFADLNPGDDVEVTGVPSEDDDGIYVEAVKVERDNGDTDSDFELKGRAAAVDDSSGTFNVLGITMTTTVGTVYDDGLANFLSINDGQRLEVDYYRNDAANTLVATEIERDEDDDDDLDDGFDDDDDIGDDDVSEDD